MKRVEYQKFLRTKLDDEHYRDYFGLSDNIELQGEDDIVLQREFRIDFVFRKIEPIIPLDGIFSYFKIHNLFEFKSVNDALDLRTLWKYLGEMFWWLHAKADDELDWREVTLTVMTVRRPINVLNHLRQTGSSIGLGNPNPGHYHWLIMGIPVHLLVINELDLLPEHYAWLSFAEGRKFEAYQEQLSEEVSQGEESQIYLDILTELEEEGKERMAYDVLIKIIDRMPPERLGEFIDRLSPERRQAFLLGLALEEDGEDTMAYDVLRRIIDRMPPERLGEFIDRLSPERRQALLLSLPSEQLQDILARLPKEELQKALAASTEDNSTEGNGSRSN